MCTAPEIRRPRGLTLLEVVVGLAILSMMAGAIHAIVSGAVTAAATLELTQREDRRVETFLNRTRMAFARLPEGATVTLKILENEPLRQELVLTGVPEAFVWGSKSRWERAEVTLCPMPWEDGRAPGIDSALRGKGDAPARVYSLSMSVPDFFRTSEDGEPLADSPLKSRQGHQLLKPDALGRFWFDLLPEVDRVEWRFYDPKAKVWIEQSPPARPPMVELRLFLPGRTTPVRAVFATS